MKQTAPPNPHPPITYLPNELLEVCELDTQQGVQMSASHGLLVLVNKIMTAGEMVAVIAQLHQIADNLQGKLATHCGVCDNCDEWAKGTPKDWLAHCSLCNDLLNPHYDIHVPDYLRDEAGIALDAKLEADTDEDSGEIILREAQWEYDISDVPEFLLKAFLEAGICLPELDEAMRMGYTIHGDE